MSAAEIIEKLPELPPEDLELIWEKAGRLLSGASPELSPELLAALEEAETSLDREGGVPIEDVMRKFGAWPGK